VRDIFLDEITKIAREDSRVVFVTAECGFSVTEGFAEEFPQRYYNVGIAEQSHIGTSAGLALRGLRPVAYNMAMFLTMRSFEQIRQDVAYQNLPVLLAGVGPGMGYGQAGTSHHAHEDMALMRTLPNMTIVCPASEIDVRAAVRQFFEMDSPMYLSLPRAPQGLEIPYSNFAIGKAIQMTDGSDAAIFAAGSMLPIAMQAAKILADEGKSIRIYNMHTIKPLDTTAISKAAKECGAVFSLEEASIIGGLGGAMAEYISENAQCKFKRLGIADRYPERMGDYPWLLNHYGIDAPGIANSIREVLGK